MTSVKLGLSPESPCSKVPPLSYLQLLMCRQAQQVAGPSFRVQTAVTAHGAEVKALDRRGEESGGQVYTMQVVWLAKRWTKEARTYWERGKRPEGRHHRCLSHFKFLSRSGPPPGDMEEIALAIFLEHRQPGPLFPRLISPDRHSFCGLVWEPHLYHDIVSLRKRVPHSKSSAY